MPDNDMLDPKEEEQVQNLVMRYPGSSEALVRAELRANKGHAGKVARKIAEVPHVFVQLPASGAEPARSPLEVALLDDAADVGSQQLSGRIEPTAKDKPARNLSNINPTHSSVKKMVGDRLKKVVFVVEDYYTEVGFCQKVARSSSFMNVTLVVIVLNTLWIAIDTDFNKAEILSQAPLIFQLMDNFFCTFFTVEIAIRVGAYRRSCDALMDKWFAFDLALVSLMVWETWIQVFLYWVTGGEVGGAGGRKAAILRIFRIFRLSRVARMARLLRSAPELMILVKGMAQAMRSVVATLVLLVLVIYIFAIMFTQLLSQNDEPAIHAAFATVPDAMHFLLTQVVCGFDADFVTKMLFQGTLFYTLYLLYMLLGSLTILNMLIGVLCEVVSEVAQVEKEEAFLKDVEFQVHRMVERLDMDGSQSVSKEEFDQLMESSELMQNLQDLGVDVIAFVDFARFVLLTCEELDFQSFLDMVIQFRGAKVATVKDIVDMRKFVSMELSGLEARMAGCENARSSYDMPDPTW